eukprot:CAMPEP_0117612642 /NCGR_PEP_ID=MMETSP0784-20121206/83052_1 /TAXON_ID=39447 /ORGANISM="" /LENGTH=192 /DNA_ID=CAMNT_0005416199 /DNA_START=476 /DNA_END=1052 /DNA_ORIENTATION=-
MTSSTGAETALALWTSCGGGKWVGRGVDEILHEELEPTVGAITQLAADAEVYQQVLVELFLVQEPPHHFRVQLGGATIRGADWQDQVQQPLADVPRGALSAKEVLTTLEAHVAWIGVANRTRVVEPIGAASKTKLRSGRLGVQALVHSRQHNLHAPVSATHTDAFGDAGRLFPKKVLIGREAPVVVPWIERV